ncbi:MAG: pyridoxamine 5'-phosphate oxidase [Actinobacteria bacterium 13_2_20CM_2_72_6]|nr:MAG: pyridoxamine 5'-phosphate oxidase [Actinobacteria bacterium 13_2_20CM_2_72_6]
MVDEQPVAELDARYSGPGATAQSWARADGQLRAAELFWISTVRPDGRPHVTPLVAVWLDGSMFFSTGPTERKAKNLAANPNCILTTGQNSWNEGFDIVVEGAAERVTDDDRLRRVAAAFLEKYGDPWRFDVRDGAFQHEPGEAWVFEVAPSAVFGFGKGEFSQTRWSAPR